MGRLLAKLISEMRTHGETSFSITLSTPTDMLLPAFAKPSGIPLFMMPKRVADTPATTPLTDYTGSGPFKFVASEFEPGVLAVYEKFEGYVPRSEPASGLAGAKVAKVDRIERIEMADPLTSVNALLTHEVDYLETVPYDLLPMVEGVQDVTIETADTIGYQAVYRFNSLHPPFDNKLARQAAIAAIGQDAPLQAQIGNPNTTAPAVRCLAADCPTKATSTRTSTSTPIPTARRSCSRRLATRASRWCFSKRLTFP